MGRVLGMRYSTRAMERREPSQGLSGLDDMQMLDKLCCARLKAQHCIGCPHRMDRRNDCRTNLYLHLRASAKAECKVSPREPKKLFYQIQDRRFHTTSWVSEDRRFCKAMNRQLSPLHRLLCRL